jgi:hypothetical protein
MWPYKEKNGETENFTRKAREKIAEPSANI